MGLGVRRAGFTGSGMSLFSMATGAGKQAEKLRLRKAETKTIALQGALERAQSQRDRLQEIMRLQNLLTAAMIRRKVAGIAKAAKLSIREFSLGGRFSQFSRTWDRNGQSKLKTDFSKQFSDADSAALGLFGTGAALNLLAGLDRTGVINIPDWHVPLGDLLADWNVPGGEILAEAAAEIGADTLLDVIGDATIILGIAKGLWNLKKASDFSGQADSLESAASELEKQLARECERMEAVRNDAKSFDNDAFALFKAATLIEVVARQKKRIPSDLRARLSDALSERLAQFNLRLSQV